MVAAENLVEIAALVGDTARATVLAALMGGQSLTASELAALAGVAKSTMSEHLTRLERAGLVSSTVHRQFKYYRIASPRVAAMMESITVVAAIDCPPIHQPKSAKEEALRMARTCYDHFAGRFGVALANALVAREFINLTDCGGEVTPAGWRSFAIRRSSWTRADRNACSVVHVWIGASAAITSPESSAPACAEWLSSAGGSRASRARVQFPSPRLAVARSVTCSASISRCSRNMCLDPSTDPRCVSFLAPELEAEVSRAYCLPPLRICSGQRTAVVNSTTTGGART